MTRPAKHHASVTSQTSEERFDDLVEEVTQRLEAGESVEPNQFLSFGPELVERLRRLLPTLQAMAALHSGSRSDSRPARTAHVSSASLAKNLGDFQLGDELGRGGMGIVFAAEQRSLARRVAVKVLPWAGLLSEVALERFRTEARAAASLAHEHIVPVYAVGCERGIHFYAMKFVDGCTLADVVRERREAGDERRESGDGGQESGVGSRESGVGGQSDDTIPFNKAALVTRAIQRESDWYRSIARLGLQAARALAHAHAQGIVHRDVKPSNLLIDKTGRLWLSDFGLARLEADAGLTRTGDLLGTLRYMSPEQALGQSSELDARADIYSLGATLYECLTLKPAIAAASRSEILRQAADPRIASLRRYDPNIPESLERIILKCLRPDSVDRYQSAEKLADDLERFQRGDQVKATLPSRYQQTRRWAGRHPTTMLAAVAALATVSVCLSTLAIYLARADNYTRTISNVVPVDSFTSSESPVMPRSQSRSASSPTQPDFPAPLFRSRPTMATSNNMLRRVLFETLENRSMMAGFNFSDFSDASGLSLIGNASTTTDHRLRLTPDAFNQQGAAWYALDKPMVGAGFDTTFQFQLGGAGGDGFTFVVQNTAPAYLGGGGGNLGYNALANSLVVEFDTFQNTSFADPSHSHISIHTNGINPNTTLESSSIGSFNTNPKMNDGNVHTARITYSGGTLSVYLDDLVTPKISSNINLAQTLSLDAGRAWIGFTAAAGAGQSNDILNWQFDGMVPATVVNIGDISLKEGHAGTSSLVFTVSRTGDLSAPATANWSTFDGTATAPTDYIAALGQITFEPDQATQAVAVTILGDAVVEGHESLSVILSNLSDGVLLDDVGIGTILNDDTQISIGDASADEGSSATKFLDAFVPDGSVGFLRPRGIVFGPDGNLYVGSLDGGIGRTVLRFSGQTGQFMDVFADGGSNAVESSQILFHGTHMFVATGFAILRFDAATGIPAPASGKVGANFATPADEGETSGVHGLAFGPDGNLYVTSSVTNRVLKYDGSSGDFLGVLVAAGAGGMVYANALTFGTDGHLYVASSGTSSVLRFQGPQEASPGALIDTFVSPGSGGLAGVFHDSLHFGPGGDLYVSSNTTSSVLRFDGVTGNFKEATVMPGAGGLSMAGSFTFDSTGRLYVVSQQGHEILRYGAASLAAITVTLSAPSALPVTVNYSTASGTATTGVDFSADSGTITFAPGEMSRTILLQTLDDALLEPSETFFVNLSNPVGAGIADGQGIGTVVDNEIPPTKFYVVDDGSANKTFEYDAVGGQVEDYAVNTGNSAPRGAVSTVAGDQVWVVDNNRQVFVYDTAGGLLGSWTAGTLNGSSQPQGIATDGTDVWIVDAKSDKVYRYAGAATRLSGSQSAASSFALNSGNKGPTDIVTDGASLWVVNNSSTDKVFRYSLNGQMQGSWTISGGGGSPTGITLDPSNPDHLWIVDNNTDRVYQYDNATTRTSGALAASTSFALATGNGNPQGIADPPVGEPAVLARETIVTRPTFADLVFADLRPGRQATLRPARKLPPPVVSTTPVVPIRTLDLDRPQIVDEALTDYLREEGVGRNKCTHAVPADSQWTE